MKFNKNLRKELFLVLFKTLFLIVGLNIFLSSVFTIIKLELKKVNSESEINLNIKKLKYDQNVLLDLDIY